MEGGISFEDLDILCKLRDIGGSVSYRFVEEKYDGIYTKNPLGILKNLARNTDFVKEIWVDGHHKNYQNFPYFELTKKAEQYLDNFKIKPKK